MMVTTPTEQMLMAAILAGTTTHALTERSTRVCKHSNRTFSKKWRLECLYTLIERSAKSGK